MLRWYGNHHHGTFSNLQVPTFTLFTILFLVVRALNDIMTWYQLKTKHQVNYQSIIPFPSSFNKSDPDIQFLVSPGVSWMMTKHEPWISSKYFQWSYSSHMKLCVRRILDISTLTEINFTRTLLFTSPWEGFLIMSPDLNSVLMDYSPVSQRHLDKLFSHQENFLW